MLILVAINFVISMNTFEQIIMHVGNLKSKISVEVNSIRIYHALNVYLGQISLRILQKLVKGSLFNSMQNIIMIKTLF